MTECSICGDLAPYSVFVGVSDGGLAVEHRCAKHHPDKE